MLQLYCSDHQETLPLILTSPVINRPISLHVTVVFPTFADVLTKVLILKENARVRRLHRTSWNKSFAEIECAAHSSFALCLALMKKCTRYSTSCEKKIQVMEDLLIDADDGELVELIETSASAEDVSLDSLCIRDRGWNLGLPCIVAADPLNMRQQQVCPRVLRQPKNESLGIRTRGSYRLKCYGFLVGYLCLLIHPSEAFPVLQRRFRNCRKCHNLYPTTFRIQSDNSPRSYAVVVGMAIKDDTKLPGREIEKNLMDPTPLEADAQEKPLDSFSGSIRSSGQTLQQLVKEGFGTKARNVGGTLSVGDFVVPLCGNLTQRQLLANRGIYAGVDYKICDLIFENDEESLAIRSMDEVPAGEYDKVTAMIRPKYPLRDYLERPDWPVPVKPMKDVPLWLSEATYQAGTAVGTLALAFTYFSIAAVLAFFIRFVYVPTESMVPALGVGDVILVTRSVPFVASPVVNDIVLFNPPQELDDAILNSKVGKAARSESHDESTPPTIGTESSTIVSTKGKQLLKRVMAVPGESAGVRDSRPFAYFEDKKDKKAKIRVADTRPYNREDIFDPSCWNRDVSLLNRGEYFVAGDNGSRSVDSRVWGPLKEKYVFGTAKWVLYPPDHFGPVPPGPLVVLDETS
jgi:signal peptidase I